MPEQIEDSKLECEVCHRVLKKINFYQTRNYDKYPDGYLHKCKKCLTVTVNNWKPSTFLHILQEIDVPYIPKEWNSLLNKYGLDPRKTTGTTILGRYLSKMKLRQYDGEKFKDTEKYVRDDNEQRKVFLQQVRSASKGLESLTDEDLENTLVEKPEEENNWDKLDIDFTVGSYEQELTNTDDNATISNDCYKPAEIPAGFGQTPTINYEEELTSEEQKYLIFKWGKSYSLEDLVRMETLYQETAESFDVSNPNHKDYLKKICKASLQLDRSLDYGDSDSAAKYSRMYDMMNKSAKFTAAANKTEKEEFIGSVGELVAVCEKEGFIPRFHNEEQKDIVDKTLEDMNNYVEKLISNEMNLSDLIESAIQMIAIEEAKQRESEDEELTDEELMNEEFEYEENMVYDDELDGDL